MTYHPCSAETSRKSEALTYTEPLGPPRPVARHLYFTFTLHYITLNYMHIQFKDPTFVPRQLNVKKEIWSLRCMVLT